jgi:hypothetical protein
MNCKTIILGFEDLVTPTGETIQRHQEIIKSTGSVCWGCGQNRMNKCLASSYKFNDYLATPKQELVYFF